VQGDHPYVTVSGRVRLIDDETVAQADIERLAIRYNGPEVGHRQAVEEFSQQHRVTIRLSIERVIEYGLDGDE
jgi:hypothetical protein